MTSIDAPDQRVRLVRRMHRVAGNLLHVARRERAQSKLALSLEYLQIELRELVLLRLLRRPVPRERIFGASLQIPDYPSFREMFEEIFLFKVYEFEPTRPDPLILDCGSNIGVSVLFFKLLHPAARVIAFEPDRETFAYLKRNVTQNGLRDVDLHEAALGGTEGEVMFYAEPERPGALTMSTQRERNPGEGKRVRSERLSKWIQEPVDFLKLDVEGAEMEVLEELVGAGKLRAIEQMVIEYHHHIDPQSDRFSRLLVLLEEGGFGYQLAAGVRQRPY